MQCIIELADSTQCALARGEVTDPDKEVLIVIPYRSVRDLLHFGRRRRRRRRHFSLRLIHVKDRGISVAVLLSLNEKLIVRD